MSETSIVSDIPSPPKNPLLEKVKIPGETFRLPSSGLFYTNGELSSTCTNGEVHVYPMSALDEIVMKSPDKVLNGDAINEVFTKCIPDIMKPDQLFAKDIDYLLIALRKVTYGNLVNIEYIHTCKDAKNHTYDVDITKFVREAKVIDPTTINSLYKLTLPNGQVVVLHPVKFKDIIAIMQEAGNANDMDLETTRRRIYKSIVTVIHSVDGITDRGMIDEWASTIQRAWFSEISQAVDKSGDWGPVTEYKTKCEDCGEEITLEVPINPIVFFTEYSSGGTEMM